MTGVSSRLRPFAQKTRHSLIWTTVINLENNKNVIPAPDSTVNRAMERCYSLAMWTYTPS